MAAATFRLAEPSIARRPVTPDDGGCRALPAGRLARLGFDLDVLKGIDRDALERQVG